MKRRLPVLSLLLVTMLNLAAAQNIVIKRFYHAPNDLTATTPGTEQMDKNGKRCALIKVETTEHGFSFDVGMLGVMKVEEQNAQHPAEIWVYVAEGVKRISIQHPHLGVLRSKDLGMSLKSSNTYIMQLATGHVQTIIDEQPTTQWVLFRLEPKDAVVFLEGEMLKTTDGTAQKMMPFGIYNWRVQAPDYLPDAGQVVVNNPDSTVEVQVRLRPNIAQVLLTVENNAEIWVNGEKKGAGQWAGTLSNGIYVLEAKLPAHRTARMERQVDAKPGIDTIRMDAPTPIYGKADINSTPAVADIYIDGQRVGQTPKRISNLLIGNHQLRIVREGYADHLATINIKENQTLSYETTLLEGRLEALLTQQPVERQGNRKAALPAWATEPQPGRWLGVSLPTDKAMNGRKTAIMSAILHYARSSREGALKQAVSARQNNVQPADDDVSSMLLCEWVDRYVCSGFTCQVENEYYNADGEYFVLCNIQPSAASKTGIMVERQCLSSEAVSSGGPVSYSSFNGFVTLTERDQTLARLDCAFSFNDEKRTYESTFALDSSYLETTEHARYKVKAKASSSATTSASPSVAEPSLVMSSTELNHSLGAVRLATLLSLPYVPGKASVVGITETSGDLTSQSFRQMISFHVDDSCRATPVAFGWLSDGLGVYLSDVNINEREWDAYANPSDVECAVSRQKHPVARLAALQGNMAMAACLFAGRLGSQISGSMQSSAAESEEQSSGISDLSKMKTSQSVSDIGIAWSRLAAIQEQYDKSHTARDNNGEVGYIRFYDRIPMRFGKHESK